MKTICILTCVLLVGVLDSAKASVQTSVNSRSGLIPFSVDAYATDSDDEDAYVPGSGSSIEDEFSVDKKKKKKKKKKKSKAS